MQTSRRVVSLAAIGTLTAAVLAGGPAGGAASGRLATASHSTSPDTWTVVSASGTQDAGVTCGIQLDATLWCWGPNMDGQLGLGDTNTRFRPAEVGTATWSQVDAADTLVCGVQTDGTLWCWGSGFGATPQQVGQATTWTRISIGSDYYCGTRSDTSLWCWGDNHAGQLGLGDYGQHPDPTEVGIGWESVSANGYSTCATKTDATLWCWGDDGQGQLGDNQAGAPTTPDPEHIAVGTSWVSVVEGNTYACGVQTDQTLWCWGNDDAGQLGLGGGGKRYVPTQVGTDADWTAVTSGVDHTCGIKDEGQLWCWGENGHGELGIGSAGGLFA